MTDLLGLNGTGLAREFARRYGKGDYHARGTLRRLYSAGSLEGLESAPEFRENPALARRIKADFPFALPPVSRTNREGETLKFTLELGEGLEIESVIIPMEGHTTLCVSSQAGCARGCAFCRTAAMGFARNLTSGEILAQYLTARFAFGADIRNLVFMGMGEPFDNLEEVLAAVDVLTDRDGPGILPRRISLSSCGQAAGLERLAKRIAGEPERNYRLLTLAVSLHSARDDVRSALMPVNGIWPLAKLRETLLTLPQARDKDKLYFEYLVIPALTDTPDDAAALGGFLTGFTAKVNLIPFVAPERSAHRSASGADMERFWALLREAGIPVFSRKSKGVTIQGSCGQLAGSKKLAGSP